MTEPKEEPKPKEMRELDPDERKLMEKRMESNNKELESLTFAKHQAELMLSEGIDADYYENKKKYKKHLSAVESQLEELKFVIEVSNKQLKEGVEVQEIPELDETQIIVTVPNDMYDDVMDSITQFGCTVKKKEEGEEQ